MLNAFQRICTQHYGDGDFAHIETVDEAREAGDTLFTFLMIELSSSEDCDSRDEAERRVNMAIDNLRHVLDALNRSADSPTVSATTMSGTAGQIVMLRFRAQAWINDNAIDVDREHPDSWIVPLTLFLERFPTEEDWHASHDDRDTMRVEGTAPRWIRDWPGPFEVDLPDDQQPWTSPLTHELAPTEVRLPKDT